MVILILIALMNSGLRSGIAHDADGLARAFARAGVGLGALAANRKATEMPDATVTLDTLKALQVHTDFAAQITFNDVFAVLDRMDDLRKLLLGEVLGPDAWIDVGLGQDIFRVARADAVNIAQGDVDALVRRNFYADDTCHIFKILSFSPGAVYGGRWCRSHE